ncbi:MAG: hypothetical protein E7269_00880 [Lachnospiraceae bacterium]|nr:hypothetical protein [Lachnospiraceae bacterium]
MSNIRNYIEARQKIVLEHKLLLNKKIEQIDAEVVALVERQKDFKEPIDVTYELFSPKPVDASERRESVQVLEVKKYELLQEKKTIQERLKSLAEEEIMIQESLTDLRRLEQLVHKVAGEYGTES